MWGPRHEEYAAIMRRRNLEAKQKPEVPPPQPKVRKLLPKKPKVRKLLPKKPIIIRLPKIKKEKPKRWERIKCWCGRCPTCRNRNNRRNERREIVEFREAQEQYWKEHDEQARVMEVYYSDILDSTKKKTKGKINSYEV